MRNFGEIGLQRPFSKRKQLLFSYSRQRRRGQPPHHASIVGWLLYGQRLDLPAIVGMAMIVGGVLVMRLFSKTTGH